MGEHYCSKSNSSEPTEISDSDPDPVYDRWIQALGLYQDDKTALLSQGELTDNIINAVHTLLSLLFPCIAGLQDICSVQILHTGIK